MKTELKSRLTFAALRHPLCSLVFLAIVLLSVLAWPGLAITGSREMGATVTQPHPGTNHALQSLQALLLGPHVLIAVAGFFGILVVGLQVDRRNPRRLGISHRGSRLGKDQGLEKRMDEFVAELLRRNEELVREALERERTVKALREHGRYLETLLDTIPTPVFCQGKDGQYLGCNEAFAAYFGLPKEQVAGTPAYKMVPQELAESCRQKDRELFDSPGIQVHESLAVCPDGSEHDVVFHKAPLHGPDGTVAGLIGTMIDMTDQKYSERRVAEALEFGQEILRATSFGVSAYRSDGQCVLANHASGSIIGSTRDEILNQNFRSLDSWKTSGLLAEAEKVLATGVEKRGQIRLETIFGKEVHLDYRLTRFSSGGKPYLLVVTNDITELKQAQDALRRANEFQAQLLETAGTGILVVDQDQKVTGVNEEFCFITGFSREEVVGKSCQLFGEILSAEGCGLLHLTRQNPISRQRCRMTTKDGRSLTLLKKVAILTDNTGNHTGGVLSFVDVTDLIEAREQVAAESAKLRSMIEGMEEGVVVADENDVITEVNSWFLKKVGRTRQDLVSKSLWDFHPAGDTRETLQTYLAAVKSGQRLGAC